MRRYEALTIAVSACAALARPGIVRAQTASTKITLAGTPTEDATNLYYAVKTGMFARAGLDVDMVLTSTGTAAMTGMTGGTYELGRTSLMTVFAAYLNNLPLTIVAPDNLYTPRAPFSLLQIATDAPFKTGADLNGKTIGSPSLNDLNVLATRAWVDKNGGDWRSLKFVEIPNAALEAAIVARRVDAAILQLTSLDASLAAGTSKTLGDACSAIAPEFLAAAWVGRHDWVQQHGDVLRKINRVLTDAGAYVNAHHAETLPLVAELTKIQISSAAKMRRTVIAPNIDSSLVQPLIDATFKYGQISRSFPARDILWQG